jgi:hypothetical protein
VGGKGEALGVSLKFEDAMLEHVRMDDEVSGGARVVSRGAWMGWD